MQDCPECRRLERQLEESAIHFYEESKYIASMDSSDPKKLWAEMALVGAREAMDECQTQFNQHVARHAAAGQHVGTAQ
jgi:hypothetical protein